MVGEEARMTEKSLQDELLSIKTVHHTVKVLLENSRETIIRQELRILELDKKVEALTPKIDVHKSDTGSFM